MASEKKSKNIYKSNNQKKASYSESYRNSVQFAKSNVTFFYLTLALGAKKKNQMR